MPQLAAKSEERAAEVFIGSRNLGREVYNILPTFDLLLKQIEQIREQSRIESRTSDNGRPYRKDVNNTIGIFGARGTGKTSVLFTLINELIQNDKQHNHVSSNMILGIVEPDHLGDNSTIMGSIVGLLNKMAQKQLQQIRNYPKDLSGNDCFDSYFSSGLFKSNNKLQSQLNDLIEYHMYTENEYRQILIHTYDDMATHIKKSAKLLTPDTEFKDKLHKLLSLIIDNQRELLRLISEQDSAEIEPLVFLIIDDIDLKMTRSRELIEAIQQYANHPNIVTVLSGDYDILLESIMLALIQDERLHLSNLNANFNPNNMGTIKERKQNLAHEYVKKIIPPARRHQLLQWNENTIPHFAFEDRETSSQSKWTLMSQLERLFGQQNLFSYRDEKVSELQPIQKSYSIFDRTPRGIVNVYYHIHEMNEQFNNLWQREQALTEEEREERFTSVKSLIDTILLSSTRLAAVQRIILEQYVQWGHDGSSSFLDYTVLDNIVKLESKAVSDQDVSASEYLKPKYESNLLLPLVIIGEIIISLVNGVRYNEAERQEQQLKLLNSLLNIESENKRSEQGKFVSSLLPYIQFDNAMIFANALHEHKNWLVVGDIAIPSALETEKRNRWLLNNILVLLKPNREKNLLLSLYQEDYVHVNIKRSEPNRAREVLDYLSGIGSTRNKYLYYETLYKYPDSNTWSDWNNKRLQHLLFNLIMELHEWDEDAFIMNVATISKLSIFNPAASKLNTIFTNKRMMNQSNKIDFTNVQKNAIDNLILEFYRKLFERLTDKNPELKIVWKSLDTVNAAIEQFKAGSKGLSTSTKYHQTQNSFAKFTGEVSISSYLVHVNALIELGNNSYAWYGRMEAKRLLQTMTEQAYFSIDNFEENELKVLRNMAVYLRQVNDVTEVDESYDVMKQELQRKVEEGYRSAMAVVIGDLNEVGMEPGEEELEQQEPVVHA